MGTFTLVTTSWKVVRMQTVIIISSLVLVSITTTLAQRPSAASFSGGFGDDTCKCADFTTWNNQLNREVGNCMTRYQGRRWCYIKALPPCKGEKESRTTDGLFYSFSACGGDIDFGPPADPGFGRK